MRKKKNDQDNKTAAKKEVIKTNGLTEKQQLFCYYYMQSFNAYQSAIKAGYGEKYSLAKSYKILQSPSIKAYLNKMMEEREAELLVAEQRILNRHLQIAFADMNNFINPDGTLKENVDGTLIKKITIKDTKLETDEGTKESRTVSLELEDRKESLKFLTKYFRLDEGIRRHDTILLD